MLFTEGTFDQLAHFEANEEEAWKQAVQYFESLNLPGGLRGKTMWMNVGEGIDWWKHD